MELQLVLLVGLGAIAWWLITGSGKSSRREAPEDRAYTSYEDARVESLPPFQAISGGVKINYQDFRGQRTERVIDLRAFAPGPPGYIAGICALRGGYRTFKLERISQMVDVTTGEIIAQPLTWLQQRYDTAPERAWEQLLANDMPALRLLHFVGKADGQFTAKERDIVVDYCQRATQRTDITRQQLNNILRDLPATSITTYRRLCGEIAALPPDKRQAVVDAARAIVATQKTAAPEESEALAYLDKRLAAKPKSGAAT